VNLIQVYEDLTNVIVVDLHESICAVIPSLVDMLEDGHWNVRSVAISGFVELADQGEFD
jgi:hypothetical protein